jgi:Carboxypeptidase regulatory-like domain
MSRDVSKWVCWAAGVVILIAGMAVPANAQTTGEITGTITDTSDAVVSGATVIVRNARTGEERTLTTNSLGQYVASALPVSDYEIEVTAAGFKKVRRAGLSLSVATRLAINIQLEVGELTETVSVDAAAPVVETEKGDLSYLLSNKQVTDLAVNGRTFTLLQQLTPGASRQTGDEGGVGFSSSKGFAINGQRTKYSGLQLDGVENTDMGNQSGLFVSPGMETLSEVKIQTSNYSAEYGTAGGANILAVTRAGTRAFHGAAYEFLRNDSFDARNAFATSKPTLRYNNFGYRIGGPVTIPGLYNEKRDKTFFFFAQEWRRRRTQQIIRAATPTPEMRSGDFAAEAARIGRPLLDPDTKLPFANNQIPSGRLNRNAQLLLTHVFPQPNSAGFLNYQQNGGIQENWRQDTINITHDFTPNVKAMVRYIQENWTQNLPTLLFSSAQSFPTIGTDVFLPSKSFVAKLTTVINPTLLNEFSFNYGSNYGPKEKRAVALRGNYLEPQGFSMQHLFPRVPGLPNKIPNLGFTGGWGTINSSYYPWWAHHNIAAATNNLSKTIGSHSFKFGGTYQFSKTPVESQISDAYQGGFTFDGSFTNHPIADFMMGRGASYRELDKLLAPSYDYPQLEIYAQDTWKVNPNLTLNLGVRWFYLPHLHEANDLISPFRVASYDPTKAVTVLPDGTIQSGSGTPFNGIVNVGGGIPRSLVDTYYKTFGPRLGFAWDPSGSGKTSIRGGYGIGYFRIEGNDTYAMVGNPPRARQVQVFNPLLDNPGAGQASPDRPVNVVTLDPKFLVPTTQTYSLGIQRELVPGTAVSVSYVGTRGTHLDRARDINQPLPLSGFDFDPRLNARTIPTELIRPFKGFGTIRQNETTASSTYHSLQATLQRRFSKGLLFESSYTWSRAITDASAFGETPQNAYNLRAERGPAGFDRTHMLILNYIYELPFFHDRSRLAGKLLGGWQISGITQFQGGVPLNLSITGTTIGLVTRPNVKAGASSEGPQTAQQWFNTGAFEAPAAGFFGNAGRNLLRGPGINSWDMSLFKTFAASDRVNIQFRAESFNAFNHTNFDVVNTQFGAGNFGQVTSSRTARVVQFGLKVEF